MSATMQKAVSLLIWSGHWILFALAGWHGLTRGASLNSAKNVHASTEQQSADNVPKNVLKIPHWVTEDYSTDDSIASTIFSNQMPLEDPSNDQPGSLPSTEDQPSPPTFLSTTFLSGRDIPPFMINIFNKFSQLTGKRPKANIVRSFLDQEEECPFEESELSNSTTDRLRDVSWSFERALLFNVTLPTYETLDAAELRIFMVVASSLSSSSGAVAKISIFDDNGASLKKVMVRTVYRLGSGWESFFLTDFMRKFFSKIMEKTSRISASVIFRFRIRFESASFPFMGRTPSITGPWSPQIKMDCSDRIEYKTLLVVYSDDARPRSNKEKMQMSHTEETTDLINIRIFDTNSGEDSLSTGVEAASYQVAPDSKSHLETDSSAFTDKGDMIRISEDSFGHASLDSSAKTEKQPLSHFVSLNNATSFRSYRRKRAARNYCRRTPMEVDFRKIGWDTWVKFPRKYQAYKCVGKCFYPITSNWSPSNHALVQSLMHIYDKSVSRPCCVPVEFGSISMIYLNENDILTVKYDYQDMVVTACGCQ